MQRWRVLRAEGKKSMPHGCVSVVRGPDPCAHEWTNSPRGKAKRLRWQNPESRKVGHFQLEIRGRREASLSLEGRDGWVAGC